MDRVQEIIATHGPAFLAELGEFLRFPSVNGNQQGLHDAAGWVANRLTALGCQVRLLPTGPTTPDVVFGEVGDGPQSILSYTHYDVQPVEPLELWESPPFEASLRNGKLYGRGSCDDKGDVMARIHAVEVYRLAYGELPLRLKFFVEGEEEIGSPHLAPLATQYADLLRAGGVLWEGGEFDEQNRYTFYCGVKGICFVELRVQGAARDLHSAYAAYVPNPAWRLVHALNTLKDEQDRITIDGLMDYVRAPSAADLAYIARIPFAGDQIKANWGIRAFINDCDDREALTRFLTSPTCTICGLVSGWTGEGTKTVLPSVACGKIDFRLVPDLTPQLVTKLLRAHLDRRGFTDVEIASSDGTMAARSDLNAPVVQTAIATARQIYGHEPVVYPSHGGSGPMYSLVQGLGMDGIMAGVGYVGSDIHSPNEHIRVDDYFRHIAFLVEFMRRFAQTGDSSQTKPNRRSND
jgi:acetylornithine deacetylase/succinyl-diaminopimelate desuccinylase-like protein